MYITLVVLTCFKICPNFQVPSTLSQSLNLGTPQSSDKVEEKIQDAAFNYKDNEAEDVIDSNDDLYPGYDNYIGYESYEAELQQRFFKDF